MQPPRKQQRLTPDMAKALALSALTFIAQDEERIGDFIALTGIDPGEIRTALGTTSFQSAILDHLMQDENLLLSFAAHEGCDPELVVGAHALLSGPQDFL